LGPASGRFAQTYGLQGLAALDRVRNCRASARHEARLVLGIPDIPLGAELRGLQLKIGALELWVLPDRIRRPDGGVPKCLSGRGALSKEATPLDDPAIAVGRELLFADHPTVLIALRRAYCDGIATVGACRHFMQTRAIRHALAQIRLTQHLTDI
jgi:hypothetical protein